MAVMDEFREEREAMKDRSFKERFAYFWDYYRWHVIIIGCISVALISIIYNIVTAKDIVLYAVFPNCFVQTEDDGAAYKQTFEEHLGIDTKKYEVYIDTSMYLSDISTYNENTYAAVQKIATYVAAGEIDVMVTDIDIFNYYAYLEYLADISTILTPEQLEKYADKIYYMDYAIVEEKQAAIDANGEYTITYPDPTRPEDMKTPIPIGIYMDEADPAFSENYRFTGGTPIYCVIANTDQIANVQSYLDYVMEGIAE